MRFTEMGIRNRPSDLVSACLELLTLRGIMAWRVNTTGVWDAQRGIFRKFSGRKGIPDIAGILDGGRALHVECKTGTGRVSDDQRAFLTQAGERGALAVVVRSVAELDAALRLEGVA